MAQYNLNNMGAIIFNGTSLKKVIYNGTQVWWDGVLINNGVVQENPLGFTGAVAYYSTALQPLGVSWAFDGEGLRRACVYANVGIDVTNYSSVTITTSTTRDPNFGWSSTINTGAIGHILTNSSGTNTYSLANVSGIVYFGWEYHAYSVVSGNGNVSYMKFNR